MLVRTGEVKATDDNDPELCAPAPREDGGQEGGAQPRPRVFTVRVRSPSAEQLQAEYESKAELEDKIDESDQAAFGLIVADLGVSQFTDEKQADGQHLSMVMVPGLLHLLFKSLEGLHRKYGDSLQLMTLFSEALNVKAGSGQALAYVPFCSEH
jgi:hypothetical protein